MSASKDEQLIAAVLAAVQEPEGAGRLACGEAFRSAQELGVTPAAVGRVCNERRVKLINCQLGCFS